MLPRGQLLGQEPLSPLPQSWAHARQDDPPAAMEGNAPQVPGSAIPPGHPATLKVCKSFVFSVYPEVETKA